MTKLTRIQIRHGAEVKAALTRMSDHEDMNEARVLKWLQQFGDDRIGLALTVIRSIRYYAAANIRGMTRQLFQMLNDEVTARGFAKVGFVAVGEAGAGSGTVVRVLRDLLKGTGFRLLSMLDVARLKEDEVDALVFIDDFSGTGQTLEKWWENVEPIVRPANVSVLVGLLVLNEAAKGRIEQFAELVLAVTELPSSENVFADDNVEFSAEEKHQLLEQCQRTGCAHEYVTGFGACGLLIAFKHGCPNNSIPILWFEGPRWKALFNRRAI